MAEVLEYNKMFYTDFEPKTKNRFIFEFTGTGIPSYMVKTGNRPSIQFDKITIDHINTKRQLKGKGEWQDITITLYDPIVPSGAQAVMEWVRLSHESLTGRNGYASMYKKDIDLYMLGPVGDKIENWKIKGAFITNATFGDLDAASGDPTEISLTISYDFAILEF